MSHQVKCLTCDGTGEVSDLHGNVEICHRCEGDGVIIHLTKDERYLLASDDKAKMVREDML